MKIKRCNTCFEEKPESDFNRNPSTADRLATDCKECGKERSRQWYTNNKVAHMERVTARYRTLRAFIVEQKNVPCTDCGRRFPHYVMDFDHLEDKQFTISQSRTTIEKLRVEIAKCEVVCANCHRIRTHERRRAEGVEDE